MNNTKNDIKNQTGISTEKVDVLADELDRIQALKTMLRSDAGKVFIARLSSNCATALTSLYRVIEDKPTLEQIMGIVASYKANIDLLSELQDISFEEEIQRQLDEAVKEASTLVG